MQIAELLLSCPQHLSAEQILASLRRSGARVSKATVYNTLNLFASQGLIRQLSVDGSRAWFDSNVVPHYHFHDEGTGALTDVAVPDVEFSRLPPPPPGMEVAGIDLVIRLRKKKPVESAPRPRDGASRPSAGVSQGADFVCPVPT